jgi:hypothetical protein
MKLNYLIYLPIILLACSGASCTVNQKQLNNKLDNVTSYLTDALPHLSTFATKSDISAAKHDVKASIPLVKSSKEDVIRMEKQFNDLQTYEEKHKDDWLGPKAHRLIDWIIGIVVVMGIGYVCLLVSGNLEGAGWAIDALGIVGHLFTFGIALVNSLCKKIVAWIISKFTNTPVPVPVPPAS